MSTTFTTAVVAYEADDYTPAFHATTLARDGFSASGIDRTGEGAGLSHVTAYVHQATGIRFEAGLVTDDGKPSVRIVIDGAVNTYVTVFGVALADLAAAATAAVEEQS